MRFDLLGHGPVPASKTGLHVGHRDVQLLGGDRAGKGGVHVSHHHDHVRRGVQAHTLKRHHDFRGLLGMRAGARRQKVGRLGQAQLVEEDPRHGVVVMLPLCGRSPTRGRPKPPVSEAPVRWARSS